MSARFSINCLLVLMLLTGTLLAFTGQSKAEINTNQCPPETSIDDDSRLQAADGGIMWESVSRHLLSAVQ